MKKGELIYLACPYTHKDPKVMEWRFKEVNKVAAVFMSEGFYIFSPISHTHPIALEGNLPIDWKYWEGYDRTMLKACKEIVVLKLPDWEFSTGVKAEIKIAEEMGIPVDYIEYKT